MTELAGLGVEAENLRVADYDTRPGAARGMGEGDDWPRLRAKLMVADILLLSTPIWLGHPSSLRQRVLERLNTDISETDVQSRQLPYGKVAATAVVGNEDRAHKVSADLFQGLNDLGFTLAPGPSRTGWGEAQHGTDYQDLDETPSGTRHNDTHPCCQRRPPRAGPGQGALSTKLSRGGTGQTHAAEGHGRPSTHWRPGPLPDVSDADREPFPHTVAPEKPGDLLQRAVAVGTSHHAGSVRWDSRGVEDRLRASPAADGPPSATGTPLIVTAPLPEAPPDTIARRGGPGARPWTSQAMAGPGNGHTINPDESAFLRQRAAD